MKRTFSGLASLERHPCFLLFVLVGVFVKPAPAISSPLLPERIYTHPSPTATSILLPLSDVSAKYVGVLGYRTLNGKPSESSAFIFDVATGNHLWTFTQPIPADNVNFRFESIAIDGDTAVVGATFAHIPIPGGTAFNAGAAFVYDLATGQLKHKLVSDTPLNNRDLGSSVDILGNKIVVGSWGNAYVFDAITGQQLAKLNPSEPTGQFGISVGISESAIIAGSNSDTSLGQFTGAVFTFDPNNYSQINKYIPSDAAAYDNFGIEVAIDGQYAIASSTRCAYVFDALTGDEIRPLTLPGNPNNYPHQVDIEGTAALLGNPANNRASTFDWTTGEERWQLLPDSLAGAPNYGYSVAMSGKHIVVGAEGKVFQYSVVPEPATLCLACCSFLGIFKRR
jgi:hypothetical protein